MRNRKTLAIAAVTATALLGLSACGDDSEASPDAGPDKADIRVWLNGADTPQAARDWLKTTFEKDHPGSTLTIEEQQWEGLVERLTTALSSESETPDVVEVGNTQAPTFTEAGAFSDLSDQLGDLGGDDLLPGFVDGATVDGATYAVPYYAGSKYVFYRKDLLEAAGLEVPTTMAEFVDAAVALKKANPEPANFSGFWLPGQDWRNGVAFLWDAGGDLATEDGGAWTGSLSSPESIAGLETVQTLFQDASGAAKDGNEADPWTPYCNNEIGMMSAPGWVKGQIEDPEAGCPDMIEKTGVFALPGSDGSPAPVLLGGSDIAVSAKSPNQALAQDAVALMLSDDYQTILAENGLTPAKTSLATLLGDDEYAAATIAAASNAKLTPAASGWAKVEGARVLEDLFVDLAKGGDPAELAQAADEQMDAQLG
ncbi:MULTISPECIES: extracellular solute-binding protein [Nocardioides]|uniref:N,N'-diacetylchitobiose transport system substrate-binding protein n=1 Tax=Nocardioides lianchengensis TaxID=1045774 RepID=A0A1G6KX87_9ACTN|nr:extracellular solute-binding protein [Nocardioides lianchengensis]NYG13712.1 N,N'-diacetylchitobiose transport system substrate-binding protein [Nocardioides lianchengensis]SDC34996.1 N,N'-diacetylchitobiose transport system substrate-binding protein [Nocardioides lianchengensis]